MTAADIRDKTQLLPRSDINRVALTLAMAAWLSLTHILFALVGSNDIRTLSGWGAAVMFAHTLVLVLLLIVVSIWYRAVALHKKTPAGLPVAPEREQ